MIYEGKDECQNEVRGRIMDFERNFKVLVDCPAMGSQGTKFGTHEAEGLGWGAKGAPQVPKPNVAHLSVGHEAPKVPQSVEATKNELCDVFSYALTCRLQARCTGCLLLVIRGA